MKYLFYICSFILFGLALQADYCKANELTTTFSVNNRNISLVVHFKAGKEAWARHITTQSTVFLQALEPYLGIRVPSWANDRFTINGCDDCGARLENGEVYVPYNLTPKDNPALVLHELGHYWYYYWSDSVCQDWLIEGVVSFLPTMLRLAKLLPNTLTYRDGIDRWWAYRWNPTSATTPKDLPLCPFDANKKSVIYWKSYRLQYLIYFALGPDNYRTFIRSILLKPLRTNDAVIAELKTLKTLDWDTILTGWVNGTSYLGYKMNWFAIDMDSDGLSKAEELALGLSDNTYDTDGDLIPDGEELRLLKSPRTKDTNGKTILKSSGPFIDGSARDWRYFSYSKTSDEIGDQAGRDWADMTEMLYYIQNDYLFILVKTRNYPHRSSNVFFDLLVDTNLDYYTDHEYAFMLNDKSYPWHYIVNTQSSKTPYNLRAGIARYIEMKIPLKDIPSTTFQILPILRDNKSKTNLDEWNSWIPINSTNGQ